MKRIILLSLLGYIPLSSISAQSITTKLIQKASIQSGIDSLRRVYSYDSSGNRIKRLIITKSNILSKYSLSQERISDIPNVKLVSVNDGLYNIEFCKYTGKETGEVSIYSSSGILMNVILIKSETTQIDLANMHDGVFIIKVNLNGEETQWKITR